MNFAAMGIIINNNKILLTKRSASMKRFPNHWCLPGGQAENNEKPEETVVREVKEEVNLDFIPNKLFFEHHEEQHSGYCFLGNASGDIKAQESEVSQVKEFSFKETKNLEIAFRHRDVIEKLHQENLL